MPQTSVPSDSWFWVCLHSKISTLDNNSKYIDIGTKDSTSFVSAFTANNTRTVSICLTAYAGNLTSNFTFDIFTLFNNLNLTTERKAAYNTGFAAGGRTCLIEVLCFVASSVLVDSFVLRIPPDRKALIRYAQYACPQ